MTCEYCRIIEGKKDAAKVYEDDRVVAFLPEKPASIGHVVIIPKKHLPILEALEDTDAEHLFSVANKISIAVFEAIKSEGTNLVVHNGVEAGQEEPHFSVNIITRRAGDGLMFEWSPKQLTEQEMATVEIQLKEEMQKPEIKAKVPKEEDPEEKKEHEPSLEKAEKKEEEQEENYLIKQLRRMP